jgi:hypothetical protein
MCCPHKVPRVAALVALIAGTGCMKRKAAKAAKVSGDTVQKLVLTVDGKQVGRRGR